MLYYAESPITLGGTDYYRVSGHDLREMRNFHFELNPMDPRAKKMVLRSTFQLPPNRDTLKSPVTPRILITTDQIKELIKKEACPVTDAYWMVLCWFRKKEFYERESRDTVNEKDLNSLDSKIRAKILDLIFSGEMVFDPTHPGLEILNKQVEIFDLGRYRGLNLRDPQEKFVRMRRNFRKITHREKMTDAAEDAGHRGGFKSVPLPNETPFQRARREALERGDTSLGVPDGI